MFAAVFGRSFPDSTQYIPAYVFGFRCVIVPEDNDKSCQNRAWGINELQSPCATYHNCAWFTGVGCAITIAGTTPNPLAQYAPKDYRDL